MTTKQEPTVFEDKFKHVKKLDIFHEIVLCLKQNLAFTDPNKNFVFAAEPQERISFIEDVVPVFLTFSELMSEKGISFIESLPKDAVAEYVSRATETIQRVEDFLKEADHEKFSFACVSILPQMLGKQFGGKMHYLLSRELFLNDPIGYNAFLGHVERFKQMTHVV